MGKTISGGASSGSRARKPSGGSAEFDMKNFREFEVEEMRLAYAGALDQLTKAERAAVSDYTGSAFGAINSVLRNEGFNPESFPNSNITKQVNAIDSALQRGTLQEGAILYRGFSANNITSALESGQLKPGMLITDTGFMSTSARHEEAFGGTIQLRIFAPPGTKGLYVEPISHFKGEREFILPRNTTVAVRGIHKAGSHWNLDVEVIP